MHERCWVCEEKAKIRNLIEKEVKLIRDSGRSEIEKRGSNPECLKCQNAPSRIRVKKLILGLEDRQKSRDEKRLINVERSRVRILLNEGKLSPINVAERNLKEANVRYEVQSFGSMDAWLLETVSGCRILYDRKTGISINVYRRRREKMSA